MSELVDVPLFDLDDKACAAPVEHHRLERNPAQEHRPPPVTDAGRCAYCGKPYRPEPAAVTQ